MSCDRCGEGLETGARWCGWCGAKRDNARLEWGDDRLGRSSEPVLRRRYRALQSWYRQYVLDADHGVDRARGNAVGSVLADHEVARDPTLNFLGDTRILDYVDARVPQVHAESGKLEEHRLRHNMLSSMPMAFSLAAVLRDAPDRAEIVNTLCGVDAVEPVEVIAEWSPWAQTARRNLLGDSTAFDLAIQYRTSAGGIGLVGIETKYTEPLSQKEYLKPFYLEVTGSSSWFRPGAAERLVDKKTNQLWRQAMLGAAAEGTVADVVHIAVIGLAEDSSLWSSVVSLEQHMDPNRLRALRWEELVDRLKPTSLASFAGLFAERYLDTAPLDHPEQATLRPRRSTRGPHQRWLFTAPTSRSGPEPEAGGDDGHWGRWVAAAWRAVGDPARVAALPNRAPTALEDACAYWTPALHLMLYSLAWPSPATGLTRWLDDGRPLEDTRMSLIEGVWGRHLDALEHWLHHGLAPLEEHTAMALDLSTPARTVPPERVPVSRASTVTPNPATGGSDPLHLHTHVGEPLQEWAQDSVELTVGDPGVGGPPRATLRCASYRGWYQALHHLGDTLPIASPIGSWRVDVTVTPIGHLGTFRRSRRTGRWFAGQHKAHGLGVSE